ncbi:MAG TPA: hypothetical protein VHG72_19560 [Polyangia bacterium]|nr:hypothetical protein [Polyangia bacterium]HVZ89174.1 hypothetical protein [Polyangia bacterium]
MFQVNLSPRGGLRQGFLREISGHEELLPTGESESPVLASEIVARVLIDLPASAVRRETAWQMTIGDRDRLIAELQLHCFGDRVSSVAHCDSCDGSFEIDFSLSALLEEAEGRRAAAAEARGPDAQGFYLAPGGDRFRLVTVDDERALLGVPPERAGELLLGRCVPDRPPAAVDERTQALVEALDPVLSLELPASCAECGAAQRVDFDLARFFLASLHRERPLLIREVHWIAKAYGWSHQEILGLPRSVRRAYAGLLLHEADAARGAAR